MNGILCVNKQQGFTSFDVIAKLRGMLHMKRLGHGGTLDPMATGVLPVFVGNATKACDIVPDCSKEYRAGFRLGLSTDTLDITGRIIKECRAEVTEKELSGVIMNFIGDIKQIPPMYSAIKINGQKLCNLARQGIEIERPERDIKIESIKIESFSEETQSGIIYVVCSKGTYIRSLIDDIGNALGCGGVMTSLERTFSGGFSITESYTLEQIQNAIDENRIESLVVPVERVFSGLPKIRLNEVQTRMYNNGVKLDLKRINNIKQDFSEYTVYGFENNFIGIAEADYDKAELRSLKKFL